MDERHAVIGVVGSSGGAGASTFAAVLARMAGSSLLVDLDVPGGGVDVLLGVEDAPGARWSGIHVDGGRLDADALSTGVVQWGPCRVLAADVDEVSPEAAAQVIAAARTRGTVVLDLPRARLPARDAALAHCDVVIVIARGDVIGVTAAHAVAATLPASPRAGLVVRRGVVPPAEAARLVGLPLIGVLPAVRPGARELLDWRRPPPAQTRVAAGVLDALSDTATERTT